MRWAFSRWEAFVCRLFLHVYPRLVLLPSGFPVMRDGNLKQEEEKWPKTPAPFEAMQAGLAHWGSQKCHSEVIPDSAQSAFGFGKCSENLVACVKALSCAGFHCWDRNVYVLRLLITMGEMPICEGKVNWSVIVLQLITDTTRLFVLLYVNGVTSLSLSESAHLKTALVLWSKCNIHGLHLTVLW